MKTIINKLSNFTLVFQEVEFMESKTIRHQYNDLQCSNTPKTKEQIQLLSSHYFKDSYCKEHRVLVVNLITPYIEFHKPLFPNLLASHLILNNLILSIERLTFRFRLQTRLVLKLTPQYLEMILTKASFREITKA